MRLRLQSSAVFVLAACSSPNEAPSDGATGVEQADGANTATDTGSSGTQTGGPNTTLGPGTMTATPSTSVLDPSGTATVGGSNTSTDGTATATDSSGNPIPNSSDTTTNVPMGTGGTLGQGGTPPNPTAMGGAPPVGGGGTTGEPTGGSGGTPVTPGLGCTGNELLCEDFESVADGSVPTGAWQPLGESCQFQTASFIMGVTSELANAGTKSLKVTNKHFAECRLSGAFEPVDEFWVRAYMFWATGLDLSNRETLAIDLTPGYRTADDPAVRFGYRSKSPCEEYAGPQVTIIGFEGGEVTGCGSRPMPQGEWFCFEAHVQQASVLDVRTFINGEAISYQSTGKPQTESIATPSAVAEKVDHIRLGIFSTGEAMGDVYIDDVAVATTRLGCGN